MPLARAIHAAAVALADAWRSLKRRPGYFAIAVSSLAIALGVATTVIAHLDSLIHPDLGTPYDNRLYVAAISGKMHTIPADADLLARFRAVPQVERAAIARRSTRWASIDLGTSSSEGQMWYAGTDVFDAIGAKPVLGRWFGPNETEGSAVALITEDAWHRRLARTTELDSARLVVDGVPYRVVGVLPRGLPPFVENCVGPGCRSVDVILPAGRDSTRGYFSGIVVLRAARGTDSKRFAEATPQITSQLQSQYGDPVQRVSVRVASFGLFRPFRAEGYEKAMLVAVAMIIFIACANVSALMLARAVARRRDQALRLALGAERKHVIAGVAAEVTLIAVAGAVAGLLIGDASMRILAAVTPPDLPWLGFREPHWSPWVFVGLFGVVMLVVGIASTVPAIFVSGIAPVEQLKDNSGTTTGRPRKTFQVLVVGELALSLILLFGAVLVAKSADRVAEFDFGYEPRGLSAVSVRGRMFARPGSARAPTPTQSPPRVAYTSPDDVVNRLRREPGVRDAAWVAASYGRDAVISDEQRQLQGEVRYFTGPGFVRTLGLQIVSGRDFIETDAAGGGGAILDEIAAQRLFRGDSVVGRMIKFGSVRSRETWLPVVGVVRRAIHEFPDDPAVEIKPSVYVSLPTPGAVQNANGIFTFRYPSFVVRGERGVPDIRPRAAGIVRDLLPPETLFSTGPWLQRYDQMLSTRRFTAGMFLAMSFASLALAAAGLFGVLSYSVNQRMREFAVRVALGAQRAHVVKLVLVDGFVMALAGTAIGGAIAMYAAFVLWEWLWGVYPVDAQALIISEGILLAITALGAILPSLRATRANPVDVMRAT